MKITDARIVDRVAERGYVAIKCGSQIIRLDEKMLEEIINTKNEYYFMDWKLY